MIQLLSPMKYIVSEIYHTTFPTYIDSDFFAIYIASDFFATYIACNFFATYITSNFFAILGNFFDSSIVYIKKIDIFD
jgi:hypothetical protein